MGNIRYKDSLKCFFNMVEMLDIVMNFKTRFFLLLNIEEVIKFNWFFKKKVFFLDMKERGGIFLFC